MGSQNVLHAPACAAPVSARDNVLPKLCRGLGGRIGHGIGRRISRRISRRIAWLNLALAIRRERQDLAGMPPHLLRDIGLTDSDARRESGQPWHHVPESRLRR